jgi:hypothetical protein
MRVTALNHAHAALVCFLAVPMHQALNLIKIDVELKKNEIMLAAQWPFCRVT